MTNAWGWGIGVACMIGSAACGSVSRANGDLDAGVDAGAIDALPPTAKVCDPLAKFGSLVPVVIPGVDGMLKHNAHLSPDELTMYFDAVLPAGDSNLYVTTRASRDGAWGPAAPLTSVNSSSDDDRAAVSSDGLTLWFTSKRSANQAEHIFVATRSSPLAVFGAPSIASITSTDLGDPDAWPFETADGKELWFASERTPTQGSFDLWRAPAAGKGFGTPVQVLELDSTSSDARPLLTVDRLTLYFASARPGTGTKGSFDIWRTHRASVADGFPPPVLVSELNTAKSDMATWISADNCRIYVTANDGTADNFYLATRTP